MNLTGKCKEDFEKWLCNNHTPIWREYLQHKVDRSNWIPFSAWYGVLVDFFDSNSFMIGIEPELNNVDRYIFYWMVQSPFGAKESNYTIFHRHQAREEAIKAANDIYNKK